MKKIRILIANPAGNITIFVLDHFEPRQYQAIASQLLAMTELKGEQVAFVADENTMHMCGMEFCGNASRAFALMTAQKQGIAGYGQVEINVSGCDQPLSVEVNTENQFTRIGMPPPLRIEKWEEGGLPRGSYLVDMDGIMHIVVRDMAPTLEHFNEIKDLVDKKFDPPAMGVMFFNTTAGTLTPVVYVKEVNTTYFEGSCGSGTTAVAAAFSADEPDGSYRFTLPQPAGTITATVDKVQGEVKAVYIEGTVSLSEVMEVEVVSP